MKVLVTGGAGFIGSHIVDYLLKKDHNVAIIDNLSTGKRELINPQTTFYEANITEDINSIVEKEQPDIIIHTAAQVMLRASLDDPIHDAKTNILGTINLLEAARKHNVKKFIYTATGGARVGEPDYLPVDETHPVRPCSPYGISKHTAEHYVDMYSKLYNMQTLTFCFGNVYGPRDDPSCKRVTSLFAHLMLNNEQPIIFGDGEQTRDFIYVLDLAEFIVNSLEKTPEHNLFHLANGTQITVNKIFEILKEIINYDSEAKHIEAIKGEVRDIKLDTSLAQKELGWHPKTDFEEGLRATVEYLKDNS